MTRRTVGRVEVRALLDLLRGKWRTPGVLRYGARADEREPKREGKAGTRIHSDINANVQTEPPAGTIFPAVRVGTLPPIPESTVTYCLPLWV